jgi:hypothetical protein
MNRLVSTVATAVGTGLVLTGAAAAQTSATITCESEPGQRQECLADTSAGVALVRETGSASCLLGVNWGYGRTGVWVSDGCGGEFTLGRKHSQLPASQIRSGRWDIAARSTSRKG